MPTTTTEKRENNNKCVDGSEYYGDTTYLWKNAKVLGIIVGCAYRFYLVPRGRKMFLRRIYI